MTGTNMAKKATKQELAQSQMFEDEAGQGFEGADADSFALPMLTILQKGSPQCDPDDGAYMSKAKPGMIINTVTGDLYDVIEMVPCAFKRSFIEWVHRDNGGGFVAEHSVEENLQATTERDAKGNDVLPNGNQLVDTRTHFVLFKNHNGDWEPGMISMTSTQMKKSKKWMTTMRGLKMKGSNGPFTPPMNSHIYKVGTVPEQNDKGSWRGWGDLGTASIVGPVEDAELYAASKAFKELVMSGQANVKHDQSADEKAAF